MWFQLERARPSSVERATKLSGALGRAMTAVNFRDFLRRDKSSISSPVPDDPSAKTFHIDAGGPPEQALNPGDGHHMRGRQVDVGRALRDHGSRTRSTIFPSTCPSWRRSCAFRAL